MMSVSATSKRAWHDTLSVIALVPNIFVMVIGTEAEAVPATWLSVVRVGVKVTALLFMKPSVPLPGTSFLKLLAKNAWACAVALESSVGPGSTMNLRPASAPASHACCSRALTT